VDVKNVAGTRDTILAVASHRFAERGYAGTSLAEIADDVGIRTPSLFHHFPSKLELYRAVLLDAFDDWFALVHETTASAREGWPQVEHTLRAAFRFFEERPDFVRLARWEALDGGPVLAEELAMLLRPMFERAVGFLEREMRARLSTPRDHRVRRGAVVPLGRAARRLAPRRGPAQPRSTRRRARARRRPVPPRALAVIRGSRPPYLTLGSLTATDRGDAA
jgi:AcrR family transcriptional regulator